MTDIEYQLLAILVCDLGYTEAPTHGHSPIRHQSAWLMATENDTPTQVQFEIDNLVNQMKSEKK